MELIYILNSILLGIALAMDAFSVSIADGLAEPGMRRRKMCLIAGTFAFFQFAMPMIGWICVHALYEHFILFSRMVPWIALILLCAIGIKMVTDGVKESRIRAADGKDGGSAGGTGPSPKTLGIAALILQGIATAIDALSVGLTMAADGAVLAFCRSVIIAAVTFLICMGGLLFGRLVGRRLQGRATIVGGIILIIIGLEIFIRGL